MPSFSETVPTTTTLPAEALVRCLRDARARTLALVEDLTDEQLIGPRLATVNPLLWEIGHLAWFHERFILRRLEDRPPILAASAALYDSMTVPHDARWDLPLPDRAGTLVYLDAVHAPLRARLVQSGAATWRE